MSNNNMPTTMQIKKIILLFVVLTSFLSCNGQNKEHKTFFKNGQLKEQYSLDAKGQLAGEAKIYFENGQLSTIGNYKNGKKIGERKWYWDNGKLRGMVSFDEEK